MELERPVPIEQMVKAFKERHKTCHLFKIDNFSLLKKYEVERVESSVFELCGYKMKITVHPIGNWGCDDHVFISLENQDSRNVKYELFVVSQLERKWQSTALRVARPNSLKEVIQLISHDDLEKKGFMIEDCCMFGVKLHDVTPAKSASAECFKLIEKPDNDRVTWMINKFSSFDPRKPHHSNEFVTGNRKWNIEVYPRGKECEKNKSFSVYLRADGFKDNVPKARTFARFYLKVLDQVHQNHFEKFEHFKWYDTKPESAGFKDFMPLEKLVEPYLVKDKLYVGVQFQVISVTNYC